MNQNEISDKRLIKAFKGITFSNFKKTEAKELLNNLVLVKLNLLVIGLLNLYVLDIF